MREIKFRAWDEEDKRMYCDDKVIVTFIGFLEEVYVKRNSTVDELIDYKLMQYTGLKDKNDKEIYEGDILKGTTKGNSEEVLAITYVKWDRGQFDLFTEMTSDSWEDALYNYMQFFDVEVIGNIYENPELLEGRF